MDIDKKKIIMISVYSLLIIIAIGIVFLISHSTNKTDYSFVINGEFMKEVMECDNHWHYENTSFIPCFKGEDQRVIFHDQINDSLSPQDNCKLGGYEFPGFNVANDTVAKQMYNDVMPKCWKVKTSDINDIWLKNNAECIHHKQLSVSSDCDMWKKGEMLIVINSS